MKRFVLFLLVLAQALPSSALASIAASAVWEVRTTGSDTNGGAFVPGTGTDYSQQATAQIATTDGVANGTTTLTSATAGFTAAHVGNVVYLAGGSASLAGTRRQITGYTNATTVTLDSTVASGTGLTLNLGGCLASPGMAAGAIAANLSGGNPVPGNTVWIRSGTYPVSSTPNVSGGCVQPKASSLWAGYVATRGDAQPWGTMPSLQANASSITVFAPANQDVTVANIEVNGGAGTYTSVNGFNPTSGFRWKAVNCRARNCAAGNPGGGFGSSGFPTLFYCEATGISGSATVQAGFYISGSAYGCYSHDNSSQGFVASTPGVIFNNCVSYNNTYDGFGFVFPMNAANCTSANNGGNGYTLGGPGCGVVNSVSWGNTGYGYGTSGVTPDAVLINCAGGSNGSGNYVPANIPTGSVQNFVALTVSPFVNLTGHNFALNTTPGAGAACRGAGIGLLTGGTTLTYPDLGAAQSQPRAARGKIRNGGDL